MIRENIKDRYRSNQGFIYLEWNFTKFKEWGITMFKMKEEFKTGVGFIDEQHAMLFDIAERAYLLLKNNEEDDKIDKIDDLIEELREYSIFHFIHEEAYMEKIKHKNIEAQRIEHKKFIEAIDNLDLKSKDKNQGKYITEMIRFLSEWFIKHIIDKDLLISK